MMEQREPLALPFNAVDEFKASMKMDMEKMFDLDDSVNISIPDYGDRSVNENDSSKENSFSVEDIALSGCVVSPPVTKNYIIPQLKSSISPAPKSRYNLRATKTRKSNRLKGLLGGDAEDDVSTVGGREICRPPSPKRRGRKKNNVQIPFEKIDLTEENFPNNPTNEIIALDDDSLDDDLCCVVESTNFSSKKNRTIDQDVINEEINVKITWLFEGAIKYRLRKYEPFAKIFSRLSEDKKVDKNCIILMKDDLKIRPEDTPDSINLTILDVLSGYTTTYCTPDSQEKRKKSKDSNKLELKVMTDSKKDKEMYFSINKGQKMLVLLIKVAENLNYNLNDIQLWFDGERVNEEDTTSDLDLEGDECFELRIKGA